MMKLPMKCNEDHLDELGFLQSLQKSNELANNLAPVKDKIRKVVSCSGDHREKMKFFKFM